MRKFNFKQLILLLVIPALFIACEKDEENKEPEELVPELNGMYVYGTNTVAETSVEPEAKMSLARLNPDNSGGIENTELVYGKLMHIGANSTIEFTLVEEEESTHFGVAGGGEVVNGTEIEACNINADVIRGTLTPDSDPIQVTGKGLYYVYADLNTNELRVMKVNAQMIGDATEAQWESGTDIPQVHSSVDSTVFEVNDLPLYGASGYKYRFNNGWELFNDGEIATFTHLGVESYGDAWDSGINDVGYFLDNIPHHEDGMFTVRLKDNAATGEWDETKVKTGNLLIDYTYTEMGLFGNAYTIQGDTASWTSGSDGYELHTPEVSGNVYTWTWTEADLIQDREFIFLENGAWGGVQFDWSMLTEVNGQAVEDEKIVDATTLGGEYHNFYVVEAGLYNISLVIDAEAESKIVTIESVE